jgi:glycerate 2-kinase
MMSTRNTLELRGLALVRAGIDAADPAHAVEGAMPSVLADRPGPGGSWHIIALGKAARPMAMAAMTSLPESRALIITNAGNDAPLAGAEIVTSGHPVPDAAGEEAARKVEEILRAARPADRVLALISGGGSAMLPAPVEGVSLAEKQDVNRLLLGSGADITQMNLVRQALSRLKGGGWLRVSKAPVTALILSDVPGDDLRVVASGPTVAPIGSIAEAAAITRKLGIWDKLPQAVRQALGRPEDRGDLPDARNILVGSNGQSVAAMIAAGASHGGIALDGDVEDCAQA